MRDLEPLDRAQQYIGIEAGAFGDRVARPARDCRQGDAAAAVRHRRAMQDDLAGLDIMQIGKVVHDDPGDHPVVPDRPLRFARCARSVEQPTDILRHGLVGGSERVGRFE